MSGERDELLREALHQVLGRHPAPLAARGGRAADLSRFAFAPEDVVLVVGQDGLVANVAKYVDGQPVVGFDPEPGRNPGVLVPHPPRPPAPRIVRAVARLLARADDGRGRAPTRARRCARSTRCTSGSPATSPPATSSRPAEARETQSSSGLLVGTGTGATGWLPLGLARSGTAR